MAAVVSTMLLPHQPLSTNAGRLTAGVASAGEATAGAASAGAAIAGSASAGAARAGAARARAASAGAASAGAASAIAASTGAASTGPGSCPLQLPEGLAAVDMSQPFDVWLVDLLREFDDVVNTSKTLPPLRTTNDVFHHVKTSGPPISSKFPPLLQGRPRRRLT
jgi:hypothetical protein